jgi:hypothetical protein
MEKHEHRSKAMSAAFHQGDMVEIVVGKNQISIECGAKPGMRGTVIGFLFYRIRSIDMTEVGVWSCDFGGSLLKADEDAIRKIPPDPGRELVRWNQCDWRPSRSLVEA